METEIGNDGNDSNDGNDDENSNYNIQEIAYNHAAKMLETFIIKN